MGGIPVGVWVALAALFLLSVGSLAACILCARSTYVLSADARRRENTLWRGDQEDAFKGLERRFAALADDVTADLGRATEERERAGAATARTAKREKRLNPDALAPRTRAQVRAERLADLRVIGSTE